MNKQNRKQIGGQINDKSYARELLQIYESILRDWISYRTVSTETELYKEDFEKNTSFLKKLFEENSFDVEIVKGYGNDIVLAKHEVDPSKETVLIYGHYDVQPADRSEGWSSDPFVLQERDGRYWARGVVDNKGQVLVHMVSIFNLIEEGNLGYNVVFLLEGNEETGSAKMPEFVKDYRGKLEADFVMISDGSMLYNKPTFDISFRGIVNLEVRLEVGTKDLHSGMYGGVVPNAANYASRLIESFSECKPLKNYTEDVEEIPEVILKQAREIPINLDEIHRVSGKPVLYEPEDSFVKNALFTSIEVTSLTAGYQGEGFRNAIPYSSSLKLNVRLRPWLTPEKFMVHFDDHLKEVLPDYVNIDVKIDEQAEGVLIDTGNKYVQHADELLTEVYGDSPFYLPIGAIIPIVKDFKEILSTPIVLVNLVNEDSDMHAANENFEIEFVEKGLLFSKLFFSRKTNGA